MKQIAIVVENKKGVLESITSVLADADINISGFLTNDGGEYGVIRMIVSDVDKAMEVLKSHGYTCSTRDVIGVESTDEVGSFNKLLKVLKDSNINIDYVYLTFGRQSGKPVFVFTADELDAVENCVANRGFTVVDQVM